jgi:hypothetical protein
MDSLLVGWALGVRDEVMMEGLAHEGMTRAGVPDCI